MTNASNGQIEQIASDSNVVFQFHGKGFEYFKIWIVNIILSVLTLGIYSAWATVRNHRYFYGNTQLDGSSFEYHAQPMQILKGRIIAVAILLVFTLLSNLLPAAAVVLAVLLFLAMPFLIWSGYRFMTNMSSYRNIRFGFNMPLKKAYTILSTPYLFIAAVVGAILLLSSGEGQSGAAGVIIMLLMLSIYLSIPFFQAFIQRNLYSHVTYGTSQLDSKISVAEYYKIYLKLIGWSLLIVIGAAIIGSIISSVIGSVDLSSLSLLVSDDPGMQQMGMMMLMGSLGALMIAIPVVLFAFVLFQQAYAITKFRNHNFNTAVLEDVKLKSELKVSTLWFVLLTNTVLIILTATLYYPWAKVRLTRLLADATSVDAEIGLGNFVAGQQNNLSAVGDELAEAFDAPLDLGVGI